jgi:hypothetical protein
MAGADRYMRMMQTMRTRRRTKNQRRSTSEEQAWQGKNAAPVALDTPAPAAVDPVQPALRPADQPRRPSPAP